jgi:Cu2+-exporting ATPase
MQKTLSRTPAITPRSLRPCCHCGLPAYAKDDQPRAFCCNGCMGAYAMIHELGLEDFYSLRDNSRANSISAKQPRDGILDDLDAAGVTVNTMPDGLCSVRLAVDGVHCAACTWLIDRIQPTIHGLHSAQVRMSDQTIELIYDPVMTHPANVSHRLGKLGYALSPWLVDESDSQGYLIQQREHWIGIAMAAFFAANAMWIGVALYAGESTGMSIAHAYFLRWVGTILALLAVALPGRIFFQTAWQAIRTQTPHVDIPVALSLSIGAVGGIIGAISGAGQVYFDSLASLILLLRVGRYIQFRAQHRTSLSVSQLLRLNALTATRVEPDGTFKKVPSHRLKPQDRVLVQPSEMIPADGIVLSGLEANQAGGSDVDLSLLNGESTPVCVREGDQVFGSTTNLTSPLLISVTAAGEASRAGRLMELVRNATCHRTPWIMAADRVGKWFVVVVLTLAIATWCVWSIIANMSIATQHTMALLTIACPCALALAAPLVLTVALGRAAKNQIWIRDGNCLERLATPGMLWMDKTGTLTYGRLTVLEWHGEERWLPHAAALEESIRHPVALAIHDFASSVAQRSPVWKDIKLGSASHVQHANGKGATGNVGGSQVCIGTQAWLSENRIAIEETWCQLQSQLHANGQSVVWLAIDGRIAGLFGLGDPLRSDSVETLRSLAAQGWTLGIISGDRQEIVDRVSNELRGQGIELAHALGEQLPEQKVEVIRKSKAEGCGTCCMVGDGINDAAALALADVGIAIRGGSDQAMHAAPIYLANQKFSSVAKLTQASRTVVRGIQRCFAASLLYNAITISLAMTGWIHPLIAAALMPISGLTVLTMAMTTRSFPNRSL